MTEEDLGRRREGREGERFRRRSRKYQKGLAYYEEFDPAIIPGGRNTLEHERVSQHYGAWKFPDETEGNCCHKGLANVPPPREAPAELYRLFGNPRFKHSIRAYNNVFAFTSMGSSRTRSLNVDERVTRSGVYNFRVQGSVCHRMGALLPPLTRRPMFFAQVYINDPDMEARVASRMVMTDGLVPGDNPALRHNEFFPRDEDLRLRLHVARNANPGTHNTPTASEVAAIIIDRAAAEHRDIILNTRQGGFKRIYETSESYDPLQYPLLFPYGEPGWTYDLPYVGDPVDSNGKPLTISLREYESYVLHDRTASNSLILRGDRLTQQYSVGQWAKCEQERLRFIERTNLSTDWKHCKVLPMLCGTNLAIVAANEEVAQRRSTATTRQSRDTGVDSTEPEAENIGRKVIIPPTFTGGPRYMYQRFLDAMTIVREKGAPNLFISMTCNPNWPEIKENLRPGEKASDRPNVVARVFMQS
ncbi:LOW QUALITY PROTEIN: Helitron helicase-like protein [Phytophthora palmivora]|uniref:Helitron helicase-like protein n=1 Tax=Phytophthora palmivora TaxID=4796 RepID=A0A2P4YB59_9STRA|nr:LOW QUALITY PROTEIN: Helitron helicase-like protein [Phytophthora palmivora]